MTIVRTTRSIDRIELQLTAHARSLLPTSPTSILSYSRSHLSLAVPSSFSTLCHSPSPSFQDSTFEFQKRRNVPVRYDRELVQTTLKAIQRVTEIKQRRERAFFKNRMAINPSLALASDTREVTRHLGLVQPSSALSSLVNPEKAERIREKVRVRGEQDAEKKRAAKKERLSKRSALVPASGGMGMEVEQ